MHVLCTLSTEAVFVSLRCGAQVGSRIKEGMRLRHFFMEGYHNFTVYFNNIIKTFLIWVLKYHYHIPHEEYYSVNLHKLTTMAKVTLDEHCGKTSKDFNNSKRLFANHFKTHSDEVFKCPKCPHKICNKIVSLNNAVWYGTLP